MAASADLPDRHHGLYFHLYSSPSSGGVRWRLLGANNRELGRSCLAYPDVDLCRAGLATTLLELPSLVPAVMRVDHSHWGWRLRSDSRDVVGSGHAFRPPAPLRGGLRAVRRAGSARVGAGRADGDALGLAEHAAVDPAQGRRRARWRDR